LLNHVVSDDLECSMKVVAATDSLQQ